MKERKPTEKVNFSTKELTILSVERIIPFVVKRNRKDEQGIGAKVDVGMSKLQVLRIKLNKNFKKNILYFGNYNFEPNELLINVKVYFDLKRDNRGMGRENMILCEFDGRKEKELELFNMIKPQEEVKEMWEEQQEKKEGQNE